MDPNEPTSPNFNRHVAAIETQMGRVRRSLRGFRLAHNLATPTRIEKAQEEVRVGKDLLEEIHQLKMGLGKFELATVSELQGLTEPRILTDSGLHQIWAAYLELRVRCNQIESMMNLADRLYADPTSKMKVIRGIRIELGELDIASAMVENIIQQATL